MRWIEQNTLNALTGSRSGDTLTVRVWYNGHPAVEDDLPIDSARFSWDDARQVQTLSLTVDDEDGSLAPWLLDDALGVGGSRLQVIYNVGGAGPVPIGWYRITRPSPVENWVSYVIDEAGTVTPDTPIPSDKRLVHVSGGAKINVDAEDLATMIAKYRFPAPESPQGSAPTIVGEITRLVADIVPVVTAPGVVDRPVNKSLVYQDDRLNAVQDLCRRINCNYRFNGAGLLEIYPLTKQDPVAVLKGGPEGLLVDVDREQSYEGLYNEFYAEGQQTVTAADGSTTQVPIRGYAAITEGPLAVNGPHGRYQKFYQSSMLTTQDECNSYAATMRDTQLAGLTTDLKITCLVQPHLQQGDWVEVYNAVVDGRTISLVGRVKAASMGFTNKVPDRMGLTVECLYSDVEAAFSGPTMLSLAGAMNQSGRVSRPKLTPSLSLTPSTTLKPAGG